MHIIRNGISVVTFVPESTSEYQWLAESVNAETWQWLGQTLWVGTRFADDIVEGLVAQGFPYDLS